MAAARPSAADGATSWPRIWMKPTSRQAVSMAAATAAFSWGVPPRTYAAMSTAGTWNAFTGVLLARSRRVVVPGGVRFPGQEALLSVELGRHHSRTPRFPRYFEST